MVGSTCHILNSDALSKRFMSVINQDCGMDKILNIRTTLIRYEGIFVTYCILEECFHLPFVELSSRCVKEGH